MSSFSDNMNFAGDNLDDAILKAKQENKHVLMVFSSERCRYCQYLKADLPQLDTSGFVVCIIDTNQYPEISQSFKVSSLPTSIIISVQTGDQRIVSRNSGYTKSSYSAWLGQNK